MEPAKAKSGNQSVLNTDAFDKRRFIEIYSMSQSLQKLKVEGELPTFEPLLADIWASLYKMKPELSEDNIPDDLQVNKSFMEKIMNDDSFESYRKFTRLDDLSSAIGTVKFGEKTNEWLIDQKKKDEDLQKKCRKFRRCKGNFKSRTNKMGLEKVVRSYKKT